MMLIKKGRYGIGLPRVPELSLRAPSVWRNVFKSAPAPPPYMYVPRLPRPPRVVRPPVQVVKRVNRGVHPAVSQKPQIRKGGNGSVRGAAAVMTTGTSTGSDTLTSKKVAKIMQHMGLTNGSGWVNPVTHEKWVMVKGVAVKSIPPAATVNGNELRVKLNPDVVKKFASLADNGRVQLAINLDNNRSIIVLTFDKDGKLITPKKELERMGIKVLPDGTIVLDALKALPSYYVKRAGGPHKANVAIWGRFNGINMPVSGTTVKFKG